ncbi:DBIRD complex subunit ZNF326-like [Phacochoerus africanus]|uniref:DBIRD complex subunit ZNF326-like n=1 Tax=Phacochoerus africanus TaxID=41426 RepID=UPI001FDA3FA3|nr:DBIRD complex subunit ZNF326-like [Phacochoerus africanus]
MSDFGSIHRPGIVVDYQNKPTSVTVAAARGIKRKMMQPFNKPGGTFIKKPKLAKPVEKMSLSKSPTKTDPKNEEEEKRRIEARREKQRRRREKNSEKYGDGYRMAFTCSFCKFRTFEEKDIELHLESSSHQETLDHIQKQTKFDKVVMEFLHECMVNKFKKTSIRKQQTNSQTEVVKVTEKDVMEGVTADDHMMKVETVHCSACSVYIPALHSSVQQHLKSPDHSKGKQAYKEQIKRESVLTATSILNNPIVKARYERFVKGENPFEIQDQSQDQQLEGDEEEEEKMDEPVEEEEAEEEEEEAAKHVVLTTREVYLQHTRLLARLPGALPRASLLVPARLGSIQPRSRRRRFSPERSRLLTSLPPTLTARASVFHTEVSAFEHTVPVMFVAFPLMLCFRTLTPCRGGRQTGPAAAPSRPLPLFPQTRRASSPFSGRLLLVSRPSRFP